MKVQVEQTAVFPFSVLKLILTVSCVFAYFISSLTANIF